MRARLLALFLGAGLAAATGATAAEPCRALTHAGQGYTVCTVTAGEDLRLWLTGPDAKPVGTFDRVNDLLGPGATLGFAMNAGMYHPDRAPVGLYIGEGREVARLVTADGPGNFGLLPNGVFCIAADRFAVIESRAFAADPPACRFATQSGPMLVIAGELHPRFLPTSDSAYIRNGVGVSADGSKAFFGISDARVNFHQFAEMFRDALGAPDALYFDGNVSRLYAPALGRADRGFPMGPIVGLVVPVQGSQP